MKKYISMTVEADDAIEALHENNIEPDDIFDFDKLEEWALSNGFTKEN